MSTFVTSDAEIEAPIFGNIDMQSWYLDASSLTGLAPGATVEEWVATGTAPALVRTFHSVGASGEWVKPIYQPTEGYGGGPGVVFDGTMRLLSSSFSARPEPHCLLVLCAIDNPQSGTTNTARLWGSGAVNAPNLIPQPDGSIIARCGSVDIPMARPVGWHAVGLSWTDTEMIFGTSESAPVAATLPVPPDGITQNFLGGNASSFMNGLRGAVSKMIFFDRALSATELQARMASLLA